MKVNRVASIPLVLHDPFFSIWSSTDRLYDADTVHWSGIRQQLRGYVTIDGRTCCFMGDREFHEVIEQRNVDITPTATEYTFENQNIILKVRFTSPLLLDNFTLVSRPCTYIDFHIRKKKPCKVSVDFLVSDDLVMNAQVSRGNDRLVGGSMAVPAKSGLPAYRYAFMGKAQQQPLGSSWDNVTIDWGYVYLASDEDNAVVNYDKANRRIGCRLPFEDTENAGLILAYDDLLSINYFGQWRKAYWTGKYQTILEAVAAAFADKKDVLIQAAKLDSDLIEKAEKAGGMEYAFLCCMSYRQAIAAHKLITDEEGNIIFLSKENNSNGCIGTVDVSYPSIPLFLLWNTEYVKGMMRPIYRFAESDVWEYDFAPHDVGRYPYAWGQVYGLNGKYADVGYSGDAGDVYPPFYQYPKGSDIFDLHYQMPVEECGNMLLMTAAVCMLDGSADFAKPHMDTLKGWTQYLLKYGADPGEQLCTDDFAGHLSHNVNLSAKAILGIEAYARLMKMIGNEKDAALYHEKAEAMATDWEKRADAGDHYALAFGNPATWSLKYNLIWDKLFGSTLFSKEVFEKELVYYAQKANQYGTPLDSRKDYTKSDWLLWCAAMAETYEQAEKLIQPIAAYLKETESRVPFSDWYETVSAAYCHFIARSVQGGIFMPLLVKKLKDNVSP